MERASMGMNEGVKVKANLSFGIWDDFVCNVESAFPCAQERNNGWIFVEYFVGERVELCIGPCDMERMVDLNGK